MTSRPAEQWIPQDTLGDRLRRLRRSLSMSQAQFAGAVDVTPQALASYESGTRVPRSEVAIAKRIELAFNVPAAWVLGLEMHNAPGPDGPEGGADLLPRLDSNQQPSGSRYAQVSHLPIAS